MTAHRPPIPTAPAAMARPTHLQVPMANTAAQRSPAVAPQGQTDFPMSFYDLPIYASANFSTKMGQSGKRSLQEPLPARVVRSNLDADVAEKAGALESSFPPHLIRSIGEPKAWPDLYEYFDGHDLYVDGVVFCFHVIRQIARRNLFLETRFQKEIDEYAAEWVIYHKDLVMNNCPADLTVMFSPEEAEGLDALPRHHIDLLRRMLQFHRTGLMNQQQQLEREAYEMKLPRRPVQPLYPVVEGQGPYPTMSHPPMAMQQRDSRQGDRRMGPHPLPIQPVQPVAPETQPTGYNHADSQMRRVATNPAQWNQRPRGVSDASRRTFPRGVNDFAYGRKTASNTPKGTPPRIEPLYVLNGSPQPQLPIQSGAFTPRKTVSDDARNHGMEASHMHAAQKRDIPFFGHPQAYISSSGSPTFFYIGEPKPFTGDDQNVRTVWVGPVDRKLYESHKLKELMSEVGEVKSIHWPPNGSSAFVTFITEDAVEKAISKFNGYNLEGTQLGVNRPRPRDPPNSQNQRERERSNSNFSQRGYTKFYTPRDFEEFRPREDYRHRRPSIRQYPFNGPANLPTKGETSSVMMGLHSQVSEMVQHQAAVDRFPRALSSVENLPPKPKSEEVTHHPAKQENSPIRQSGNTTPISTSKDDGQKQNARGKGKRGRGNKQNSSTRPTPASTPVKSRPQVELSEMADVPPEIGQQSQVKPPIVAENVAPQMAHSLQAEKAPSVGTESISPPVAQDNTGGSLNSSSSPPTEKPKEGPSQASKKKNKKKKSVTASSLSKSPSFVTDDSELVSSLTEAGTSESFMARSTNTSFSNMSSRKQSLNSRTSDTNMAEMADALVMIDGPQTKQRSASGRARKSSHHTKKESDSAHASQTKNDPNTQSRSKDEQKTRPKKDTQEDTKNDRHEKTSSKEKGKQKAKEDNNDSSQSLQNGQQNSARKATHVKAPSAEAGKSKKGNHDKISPEVAEPQTQPKKDAEQNPSKENEPPKTVKKDDTTTASQRKADTKGGKTNRRSTDASQSSQQNATDAVSPKPILDDPRQWPALGRVNSPQSAIADGKRPSPLPAPAMRLPQAQRKPVVPAIPLVAKKPRPQAIDLPEIAQPDVPEDDRNVPSVVEDCYEFADENLPQTPSPIGGSSWPFVKSFRDSIDEDTV